MGVSVTERPATLSRASQVKTHYSGPSDAANISAVPSHVLFESTDGHNETRKIAIQNRSLKSVDVVLDGPYTRFFSIGNQEKRFAIAPGLRHVIDVELVAKGNWNKDKVTDSLTVFFNNKTLSVPLTLTQPFGQLVVENNKLDFGTFYQDVSSDDEKKAAFPRPSLTKPLVVRNDGNKAIQWRVDFGQLRLKAYPSSGKIEAQSCEIINVDIFETIPGEINGYGKIFWRNEDEPASSENCTLFDICGKVLGAKIMLQHPLTGVEIIDENVNFGEAYFNQEKTIKLRLVNPGPGIIRWNVRMEQTAELANSRTDGTNNKTNAFSFYPTNGAITAFGSSILVLRFNPKDSDKIYGFKSIHAEENSKSFELRAQVVATNTPNELKTSIVDLCLKGSASAIQAGLTSDYLDFGHSVYRESSTQNINVMNNSETLPVALVFPRIAHFKFSDSRVILQPRSSKQISVEFSPNKLGKISSRVPIVARSSFDSPVDLSAFYLNLQGNCVPANYTALASADKNTAIAEYFSCPKTDQATDADSQHIHFSYTRKEPRHVNPEWEEHVTHRKKYVSYIRQSRASRLQEKYSKLKHDSIDVQDEIDIIQNRPFVTLEKFWHRQDKMNGLLPPEPDLIQNTASTSDNHLSKIVNGSLSSKKSVEFLFQHLEKLSPQHIKGLVSYVDESTTHEFFHAELKSEDLFNIFTPHSKIDFGSITVHSNNLHPVNFLNSSTRTVKITLEVGSLKFSFKDKKQISAIESLEVSPKYIAIPPMAVAGFVVKFVPKLADCQISENSYLIYTVNETYKYLVPLSGTINPVTLAIEGIEITNGECHISHDSTSDDNSIIRKHFQIRNTGTYRASFKWEYADDNQRDIFLDGSLQLVPKSGCVEPGEACSAVLQFTPGVRTLSSSLLKCCIIDSLTEETVSTIPIKALFEVPSSKIQLMSVQQLDFGRVPLVDKSQVGSEKIPSNELISLKTIRLKNVGSSSTIFRLAQVNNESEIKYYPRKGQLKPGSAIDIKVWVAPTKTAAVKDIILVNSPGCGKSLKIDAKYESDVAAIDVQLSLVTFPDTMTINSTAVGGYCIVNTSRVSAFITMDVSTFADFWVAEIRNKDDPAGVLSKTPKSRTANQQKPAISQQPSSFHSAKYFKKITLELAPLQEARIVIKCQPKIVGQLFVNLPVTIPSCSPISIPVKIKVNPSPLSISLTDIIFPNTVVSKKAVQSVRQTDIRNNTDKAIQWDLLDVSTKLPQNQTSSEFDRRDDFFQIQPSQGTLESGEEVSITGQFFPSAVGFYSKHFQLRLKTEEDYRVISDITFSGNAVAPSISFDPPELFLPLGSPNSEILLPFSIINNGCDCSELKYTLTPDFEHMFAGKQSKFHQNNEKPTQADNEGLEILFPEGRLLKTDGQKLSVAIKFRTSEPKSFSTSVTFLVENVASETLEVSKEPYKKSLLIHGTASNSILTCWPLMSERLCMPKSQTQKNELFSAQKLRKQLIIASKERKTVLGLPANSTRPKDARNTIFRWLIRPVYPFMNENSYIEEFATSGGKLLSELVFFLSGKRISSSDQDSSGLLQPLKDVLTKLSANGCCISTLKAEFFLPQEAWNSLTEKPYIPVDFDTIHLESWISLFIEIIRVFVVDQISVKSVEHALGQIMDEKESDMVKYERHFCSKSESLIMNWLSVLYCRETGSSVMLSFKPEEFADGSVLKAIMKPYLLNETFKILFEGFNDKCTSEAQISTNQKIVKKAIGFLLSSGPIVVPETGEPSRSLDGMFDTSLELFFVSLQLFQTLPTLLSQKTIPFESFLNEKAQKSIEISNSTTRPTEYEVVLSDSQFFTIKNCRKLTNERFKVAIPAKSVRSIDIEFHPKFMKSTSCYIVLRSPTPYYNNSVSMLFTLSGESLKKVNNTIEMKSALYMCSPPAMSTFTISNPFNVGVKLKVLMRETFFDASKSRVTKTGRGKTRDEASSETDVYELPPSFYINEEILVLPANGTGSLTVNFIPFGLGKFECDLTLLDENVGEITCKLTGISVLPSPIQTCYFSAPSDQRTDMPIKISRNNNLLEQAIGYLFSSLSADNDSHVPFYAKTKHHAGLLAPNGQPSSGKELSARYLRQKFQHLDNNLSFDVEFNSPFFSGLQQVTLAHGGQDISSLPISVSFQPKHAGSYLCKIVLKCQSTCDIRVIQVKATASPASMNSELEFFTPALRRLIQEIPVSNSTLQDHVLKATFSSTEAFFGPETMTLRANATSMYPLTFLPKKNGDYTCTLSIHNETSGQTRTFRLLGHGTSNESK